MKTAAMIALPLSTALLTACGSDSDSNSSAGNETSSVSMAMTDAAVDNATNLMLTVESIELKGEGEATTVIDVTDDEGNPLQFDLLALQGSESIDLFTNAELATGDYQWMRLHIDESASYLITDDGAQHSITIPSNAQTGLKVNTPFTLTDSEEEFVIDFDVAKSLTLANGEYKLRPTLRLLDVALVGHINGTVAPELLSSCESPVVYAFEGEGAAFEDINIDADTGPVTSSLVAYNETSASYEYELGFLESGTYTTYLVCDSDDPEVSGDVEAASEASTAVTVSVGESVELDLTLELGLTTGSSDDSATDENTLTDEAA